MENEVALACCQGKEPRETVRLNLLAGEIVVLSLEWGQNVREMLLYPKPCVQGKSSVG